MLPRPIRPLFLPSSSPNVICRRPSSVAPPPRCLTPVKPLWLSAAPAPSPASQLLHLDLILALPVALTLVCPGAKIWLAPPSPLLKTSPTPTIFLLSPFHITRASRQPRTNSDFEAIGKIPKFRPPPPLPGIGALLTLGKSTLPPALSVFPSPLPDAGTAPTTTAPSKILVSF